MHIIIRESGAEAGLSLVDHVSGVDYIVDFVGNAGALIDGQFVWDAERDAYVCDQGTYDWWRPVVEAEQALHNRLAELIAEHGSDAVNDVACAVSFNDLDEHAPAVMAALDEAFGDA